MPQLHHPARSGRSTTIAGARSGQPALVGLRSPAEVYAPRPGMPPDVLIEWAAYMRLNQKARDAYAADQARQDAMSYAPGRHRRAA